MKYVLDVHTHTLASGHAYNTMAEMACAAGRKGLQMLGITEHAVEMPGTCCTFYFENLKMVDRDKYKDCYGVELLLGTELNILDYQGTIDMEERTLKKDGCNHCKHSSSVLQERYKRGEHQCLSVCHKESLC